MNTQDAYNTWASQYDSNHNKRGTWREKHFVRYCLESHSTLVWKLDVGRVRILYG